MNHLKKWVIYTAAAFLLIAASLINAPTLYYMAAVLLALPWISFLLGMVSLRGLEFGREGPTSAWEGEAVELCTVVRSDSRLPRLFLQAADVLPKWLEPEAEEPPLFNVPAGATVRVPYRVKLRRRGAYRIGAMRVTALDPLGIYAFSRTVAAESELLVYPMPQALPDMVLSGAERFGFRDLPINATKGSGVDPDGVREYVPGDPLRRMHWKSTARTGKLNVIEFEESHAVNVVLALDLTQGSDVGEGRQSTLEYSVRAAASVAQLAIRQGASIRLVANEAPDPAAAAGRGSEHLYLVLAGLARAEANDTEPLSATLLSRVGPLQAGTTLAVFTSSADPDLAGALAHYSAAGLHVVVFYADPISFGARERRADLEMRQRFVERLLAALVSVYVLRWNEHGTILPEPVTDVLEPSSQPAEREQRAEPARR